MQPVVGKSVSYTHLLWVIVTWLKTEWCYMTMIWVYAPEGKGKRRSEKIYEELQKQVSKITKNDYVKISGDITPKIGKIPIPGIVRTFGEPTINSSGHELQLINSFYRKKDIQKYTWCAHVIHRYRLYHCK